MPKRSNVFQKVVADVFRRLAADSDVVEESAMVRHPLTGDDREVDVLVRSSVAGQSVTLAIEATTGSRKAGVQWVEQQTQKHADLGTNKLVLVSGAGFTKSAKVLARAKGATTVVPEDLTKGDPSLEIVNSLKSMWGKSIALTPTGGVLYIDHPVLGRLRPSELSLELEIFTSDGDAFGSLQNLVNMVVEKHSEARVSSDYMRDLTQGGTSTVAFKVDPLSVDRFGVPVTLFTWISVDDKPPELLPIRGLELIAEQRTEVAEFPLKHKKLLTANVAYGETVAEGTEVVFIVTAVDGSEEAITWVAERGVDNRRPVQPRRRS